MPKLNVNQETALDIIDFTYFYDVFSLTSFSHSGENKEVHYRINDLIDKIIAERQFTGDKAVIYKHFLLCGMEIGGTFNIERYVITEYAMSEGDKRQAIRDMHENAVDVVRKEALRWGFKRFEYDADVVSLLAETGLEKKPNAICFGLVAKALAFDFEGCLAAHVYRKFLDLEILETKKYSRHNNYDYQENEHVFLRAMLFIEFEIIRNKLYHQNDRPGIYVKYDSLGMSEMRQEKEMNYLIKTLRFIRKAVYSPLTSICNYDLSDKQEVLNYLSDIDVHLCHTRMFVKNNGRLISLLGLWHLKYHESNGSSPAVLSNINNDGTCSDIASKWLKDQYGLVVDAKSIYLHNKHYLNYFTFISEKCQVFLDAPKQGFVTTCLHFYLRYHPDLSEKFLDRFDQYDYEAGAKQSTV